MLIIFLRRVLLSYFRITVMLFTLGVITGLFVLGAHPFAVNLIPPPWDKIAHSILFAILAWGIGVASGLHDWRKLGVAVGGALLIGILDEWHQMYLPGRQAGWDDLAADVVGSIVGAVVLAIRNARH